MDNYLPNFSRPERLCSVSELVKIECELARYLKIIMNQRLELEQAKDKICKQELQLDEAAEILKQHQKALKASEKERKRTELQLQIERAQKQKFADRCQFMEKELDCVENEVTSFLRILTNNNVTVPTETGLLENKDSLSFTQMVLFALKTFFLQTIDQETKLKCEIGQLKSSLGETKAMLEFSENTRRQNMDYCKENHITLKNPIVKLEKLKEIHGNGKQLRILHSGNHNHSNNSSVIAVVTHDKERKWLPCTRCGKDFQGKWALTQHNRKEHCYMSKRKTTRFACNHCGFTFLSKELLQSHQNNCCKPTKKIPVYNFLEIKLDARNSSEDEDSLMHDINELVGKSVYLKPHL